MTGFAYARERWYDGTTGNFLSADPMGNLDSANLYAFCGGDPINRRDPSGMDDDDIAARQDPTLAPYFEAAEKFRRAPAQRAALAGRRAAAKNQIKGLVLSIVPGVQEVGLVGRVLRVYQVTKQGGLSVGARQAFEEWIESSPSSTRAGNRKPLRTRQSRMTIMQRHTIEQM